MFRAITFSLLCLAGAPGMLHAGCDTDPDLLGAFYRVTGTGVNDADAYTESFTLWRYGRRVAHERSAAGITDLWERTSDERLRLVRHFDEHKRGIEYQPNEIRVEAGTNVWARKRQLIAGELLESMKLVETRGAGCDRVQVYRQDKGNEHISLEWLPGLELVKVITVESKASKGVWELQEIISDVETIEQTFAERDNYRMTDYADIGDNESDPFLLKMMNLGHIAHGHSGFYDTEGNPLDARDGHEH